MRKLEMTKKEATRTYGFLNRGPGGRGYNHQTLEPIKDLMGKLEEETRKHGVYIRNEKVEFGEKGCVLEITEKEIDIIKNGWKAFEGWSAAERDDLYDFLQKLDDLPEIKEEVTSGA